MPSFAFHLIIFFTAFALSVILTPIVRHFSVKYNYVAKPRGDRWHKKATGLFGGLGIYISFLSTWLLGAVIGGEGHILVSPVLPVVLGGTAILIIGLIDDVVELNPQYKLTGQVIIASVIVIFGFQMGWFESKAANILISIFWIVGITNAFNLLDNMDGLSAGIAGISALFLLLWLSFFPGEKPLAASFQLLLVVYIGSILGFLIYNFHPASIFMGDAGSLFIGFILSCLTVMESSPEFHGRTLLNQLSVIAVPCFILFIPILDTAFVSLMRKLSDRSVFTGGLDHSSHRMVAVGLTERKAVMILYGFAAASGLIALGIYPLNVGVSIVIASFYLIFVLLFWIYLGNVKVYDTEPNQGANYIILSLTRDGSLRTFFAILMDLILITLAYYISYLLRFEGDIGPNLRFFIKSLPILYASQIFCFYLFGLYQRLWWGSRLADLSVYIKGVTSGTVLAILVLLFIYRFQYFSRAVFVIYWGVMLIFVLFSRSFFRLIDEWILRGKQRGKPAVIYGAGVGGHMVVKEIETNDSLGLFIVGFVDDNPQMKGKKVYGYHVFGNKNELKKVIRKYNVKEIIVSFQKHGDERKREISGMCNRLGLDVNVSRMRLIIS